MRDTELLVENGIDVAKGIELLGDIETYNEILDEFMLEVNQKIEHLRNYRSQSDMVNYAILVHALKSELKYLGFTKLADILYQHELESKNSNTLYVNSNFDLLVSEIEKAICLIKQYVK